MHLLSVFSLRNRALIALVTIVIAVFGGISLTMLKQELIPSLTFPRLFIITTYPGASPAVVENDVSTPIEDALQTIPGLEETSATSSASFSNVSASFAYGTNLATAEQKVLSAINRIGSRLPDGVDPQVLSFSLSDLPILQIAVSSDLDAIALSDALDRVAVPELQRLDGVGSVDVLGTSTERVAITPDPAKLAAVGLSTQAIRDAIDANGVLLPSGQITEDGQTLTVQSGQRLGSVDEIAALPLVGARSADIVTIADVATVQVVEQTPTGYSRVNGKDALSLSVTKTDAGNVVAVSHDVTAALDGIAETIGSNTEFTIVFDQAPFIEQSIESLATEGLLGLLFAVIVILVFLMSLRSTLVTAISIPASVLITFIGMLAADYTLNIITLGALTIAIGRVVDDSIVVIENIKRHLEAGEERLPGILGAVKEVAGAITASTVTTVAVFLPLALVGEEVGELFRPFALTVTIALAASLFVALTIVPVLAYWFLGDGRRRARRAPAEAAAPAGRHTGDGIVGEERLTLLQRGYLPIIRWTLRHSIVTLLVAVLVLAGTVMLAPLLKTNFIGDSGQNTLTVQQTLPPGASLDEKDAASRVVEDALLKVDGVDVVQTSVGTGGSVFRSALAGGGAATFSVTTDPDADQAEVQQAVRDAVEGLPDAGTVTVTAGGGGGGFGGSTITITVRATSEADLQRATDAVTAAVTPLSEVAEVSDNLANEQPYIAVVVDRDAAAKVGLTEIAVGGIVTAAMNPSAIGEVVIDERTLSIYVINDTAPTTLQELQDFVIPTAAGPKPLSALATVEETNGPASITSIQGVRTATVTVTPGTDDTGAASAAVTAALADVSLPTGASAEIGGVTADMADSFSQLGLALLAAILIVYVVMVATFKSLRQPLLLLVSVPFAATGAIALQVISGIPLGVPSLIGVLMLIGIVVTNAIVLVDLVNQYRVKGLDVRAAVEAGASRRLRPILMTAAATIFALLPLGLGITGHGGFISQPLAIIVIGGLVSSTLLTLVVLPTLYALVEGARERRQAKAAAAAAAAPRESTSTW